MSDIKLPEQAALSCPPSVMDREARCPWCTDWFAASVLAWHMDRCDARPHRRTAVPDYEGKLMAAKWIVWSWDARTTTWLPVYKGARAYAKEAAASWARAAERHGIEGTAFVALPDGEVPEVPLIPEAAPAEGEPEPDTTTDDLPPTQYLIMEVLAARARLGEPCWTFPARLRPYLDALRRRDMLWWRPAPACGHVQAYLTDRGRAAAMAEAYAVPALREHQDLLGAVSLYIPWRWVTQQLTTLQKDMFADAVDAWSGRLNPGEAPATAERWWRNDA